MTSDDETLDYQLGRPGLRATYMTEAAPGGGYTFILDAEDAGWNPIQVTYGGLIVTRNGGHAIESTLMRDGAMLDRWIGNSPATRLRSASRNFAAEPMGRKPATAACTGE